MRKTLIVIISATLLLSMACSNENAGNKGTEIKEDNKTETIAPENTEHKAAAIH